MITSVSSSSNKVEQKEKEGKKRIFLCGELRIYYSLNFPMYHTVVLSIVIRLYIASLVLSYLINWKFVPFHHPPLRQLSS